ncbi:MAG: hypothetical protein WEB33_01050 [Bacteroidota bacterium]
MRPFLATFLSLLFLVFVSCSGDAPESIRDVRSKSEPGDTTLPFALLTAAERGQLREQLMKEGKYDCCTRPGCAECIGSKDSCGCYMAIKSKDPICGECFDGYKEGTGKLKMVSIVDLEKIRNEAKIRN